MSIYGQIVYKELVINGVSRNMRAYNEFFDKGDEFRIALKVFSHAIYTMYIKKSKNCMCEISGRNFVW